jgi:hypothetical protein
MINIGHLEPRCSEVLSDRPYGSGCLTTSMHKNGPPLIFGMIVGQTSWISTPSLEDVGSAQIPLSFGGVFRFFSSRPVYPITLGGESVALESILLSMLTKSTYFQQTTLLQSRDERIRIAQAGLNYTRTFYFTIDKSSSDAVPGTFLGMLWHLDIKSMLLRSMLHQHSPITRRPICSGPWR